MATESLTGTGVSPGAGYGPAYLMGAAVPEPPAGARHDGDVVAEVARVEAAVERVAAELQARGEAVGGDARDVLAAQALIARDPALAAEIGDLIDAGTAAERAVYEAFMRYNDILTQVGGYLGQRVADLADVRDRVIAELTGVPMPGLPAAGDKPYVLVARDLAPADTALLSKDIVAAFVTEEGGPTSHTAILARALGVPAVVACAGATSIANGVPVLVDGTTGLVGLMPSEDEVRATIKAARTRDAALAEVTGPGATADGRPVALLANIGGPRDLAAALEHGAEGVGLYRTEFLFLDRDQAPSEEEQEAAYREVVSAFPGRPVTVRVLDAGGDKPLGFLPPTEKEPNPALGQRGVRILRIFTDVLTGQLRALARAAEAGSAEVRVMAPMVATPEDAAWFVAACRAAGLRSAGIMIEVPAAALRATDLAPAVDFFSIGTNDLAQYTFAADREVGALTAFQDPWQPVLLDLVAMTASAGVPTAVCGEACSDPALSCVLAGLGVTALSMAAPAIPGVRAALARHTLAQCRAAAVAARAQTGPEAARAAARTHLPALADLGL
ncbi:phosphoenolpyruvate-protein phosphotransferase [Sphaerisporangium melleum]|uniref:Phosphoenolpyruvate-protein phosphotransferase n=1 Tax=Sphaerisporangium melleum TaxID=321316 RepID=A0A917VD93_9ACTN|nr:phosphoenolpyruvate--protein phosphotransferase [Sphaerisporangium melleum]GGK64633.1 phosphoenolpyruvate-protein phosphotransferase [Sphaerisporangium melleum]GII70054.1 phosphoenolpyruvate-protein phosphotransferase [Sphaerisporangium melleum]